MIHEASTYEGKMAWYHSHLGSLDFARQMGLITEERRQQLYKEFGKGRPEKPMQKIDRKIDLIKRMQAEMDHRAEVEEKAVQFIAEGRHGEAVELLNSLDDSVIAGMQEEFEAEEENPRQRAERRRQQAKVILNVLAEDVINMNWNQEEEYLKAFMKALKQIEEGGHE